MAQKLFWFKLLLFFSFDSRAHYGGGCFEEKPLNICLFITVPLPNGETSNDLIPEELKFREVKISLSSCSSHGDGFRMGCVLYSALLRTQSKFEQAIAVCVNTVTSSISSWASGLTLLKL